VRVRLLAACLIAGSLSLGASTAAGRRLHLEIAGRGGIVWSQAVSPGEPFDVSFLHSQEKVRWTQHYRVGHDGRIGQTGSTFGSYGAGMPMGPAHRAGDGFSAPVDLPLASIPMLGSAAAGITLTIEGRALALDRWFQDFEPFEIRLR
jgi:hypothetical protein